MRNKLTAVVTLTVGGKQLLHYRGRIQGSGALAHAIAKVHPKDEPLQSWAGLTKRPRRRR